MRPPKLMQDFLTFKTFITPTLLIVFYYLGAMVIPIVSYALAKWVTSAYFKDVSIHIYANLSTKQRVILLSIALVCFLFMEIFWRVLFEFFVAYFDMHEALMKISANK